MTTTVQNYLDKGLRGLWYPVLASWGIRFVIINNYLAFYTIDEEKQTVIIVRFLYQKSNWTSILRQGFSLI